MGVIVDTFFMKHDFYLKEWLTEELGTHVSYFSGKDRQKRSACSKPLTFAVREDQT